MTYLPTDRDDRPIQALRPAAAHQGTAGDSSTRIGPFADDTVVISVYARGAIRYKLGDATVEAAATDHYGGEDERLILSLGSRKGGRHDYLAILRDGSSDVDVEVSELD